MNHFSMKDALICGCAPLLQFIQQLLCQLPERSFILEYMILHSSCLSSKVSNILLIITNGFCCSMTSTGYLSIAFHHSTLISIVHVWRMLNLHFHLPRWALQQLGKKQRPLLLPHFSTYMFLLRERLGKILGKYRREDKTTIPPNIWQSRHFYSYQPFIQTCHIPVFWVVKEKYLRMVFMAVVIPLVCTFPRRTERLIKVKINSDRTLSKARVPRAGCCLFRHCSYWAITII